MNLSGTWKYCEDFSHGDSEGELVLTQEGNLLCGVLTHTETPIDGAPYSIEQTMEGVYDNKDKSFILKANTFTILAAEEEILYELDSFVAQVMTEDLIVGTSEDEQGVLGVFSFKRIKPHPNDFIVFHLQLERARERKKLLAQSTIFPIFVIQT